MATAFSQLALGNWQQELPTVGEMLTAKHHPLSPTTRGAGGSPRLHWGAHVPHAPQPMH